MKSFCVITCYKQPDYVRAVTLRLALQSLKNTHVIIVKNKHTGLLRYPEVLIKTLLARIKYRPDVYLLTFRGYEILGLVRLITLGKKLVFDEFINLIEWTVYEHKKVPEHSVGAKLLKFWYQRILSSVSIILTDTASHARLSSRLTGLPHSKYKVLSVGADESIFKMSGKKIQHKGTFKVFYYSNMLPLHGIEVVIDAMKLLKGQDVETLVVGGNDKLSQKIYAASRTGVQIKHKSWIPLHELPRYMKRADVCLAGPFGNTYQAQYVITGKAYQYMSVGAAIIVGRNKESGVFTNKKDALIVNQGDARALADAIAWAAKHRDELDTIAKAGHRLYNEKFSQKVLNQQVARLFATL